MRRLSGYGWLEFIIGVLLVLLGVATFIWPDLALTGMAFVYGIAALVMGIADIVLYIRVEKYTGFGPIVSLVSGILSAMAGIMLIFRPEAGVWALTLLFPIWFITHCISRLAHADHIKAFCGNGMYVLTLVANIVGIVLGLILLFSPLLAITTVSYFAGIYLIVLGCDAIAVGLSKMGR